MEKVEVDPELFVKCRLCLEEKGIYQILPNIQHQIKYCFDIVVAHFDGLPQLICKKCESKLTEYFVVKTAYVAKQQSLIKGLKDRNVINEKPDIPIVPTHCNTSAIVNSDVQIPQEKEKDVDKTEDSGGDKECKKENSPPVGHYKTSKRKRIRVYSASSSASLESKDNDDVKVKPLIIRKKKSNKRHKWQSNDYSRLFSCRMCNKTYVKRSALLKHYSNIHYSCFTKYKSILNTFCSVKIEKVDNKPNFTGVNNTIVLSRDKIIVNDKHSKYFILYALKNQHLESDEDKTNKRNGNSSSDSADDAEYSVWKKKRKKRRRLLSSDTVVIDKKCDDDDLSSGAEGRGNDILTNNKSEPGTNNISECIITLDSDSEVEPTEKENTDSIIEENENKLIRNVIEVCHNKYLRNIANEKNNKPNYASIESQLMHKVLNLGRKIVNKQGLNCTGLLRYLEHRNLGVIWRPKTGHSFTGPQVRINMSTMKKDQQRTDDTDTGWTDVPLNTNRSDDNLVQYLFTLKDTINNKKETVISMSYDFNEAPQAHLLNDNLVNILNDTEACLYKNDDTSLSGKLLNKNPVANPKQLPKKSMHPDVKQNKSIVDSEIELNMAEINANEHLLFSDSIESDNGLAGMPIITSTTSLAVEFNQNESANGESTNTNNVKSAVSAPRIKVKPVSELMPTNISTPTSLLLNQNNINNYEHRLPNITEIMQPMPYNPTMTVIPMPMPVINNVISEGQTNESDCFILHTLELPNTKTESPFNYLKSLLQIHNICLVDMINPNFHCLIKFKVLFKQEAVKPIVLCLSLQCEGNQIYIGIMDSTNININMQDLSANWQWEIIKIFQGDVCNKINQTTLKLGADVRETSKKFLCLVKCIKIKKLNI